MAVFGRRLGLPPVCTKMSPDATGYGWRFVGPDAASCLLATSSHSGTWCVTHSKVCEDPSHVAAFVDGNGGVMFGMVVNGERKEKDDFESI